MTKLIASGAYAGDQLPSERELCEVLGASRTTIRRVLERLADQGIVARSTTGRARITAGHGDDAHPLRRIAFLAPAFASDGVLRWEAALRQSLAAHGANLHLAALRFTGWADPVIGEATVGCAGVFIQLGTEPPTPRALALLTKPGVAVASIETDLSALGIPSLNLYPARALETVLDALHAQGHRRIGWLNTQPADPIIQASSAAFSAWLKARGLEGPVVSQPVAPFEDPAPAARALMARCLDEHADVTAWLCSVVQCARGAIRAIHDRGWQAGREVSIATIDGERQEDLNVPSLACAARVDPVPHLAPFVEWILAGENRRWDGELFRTPAEPGFHDGESLGVPRR